MQLQSVKFENVVKFGVTRCSDYCDIWSERAEHIVISLLFYAKFLPDAVFNLMGPHRLQIFIRVLDTRISVKFG